MVKVCYETKCAPSARNSTCARSATSLDSFRRGPRSWVHAQHPPFLDSMTTASPEGSSEPSPAALHKFCNASEHAPRHEKAFRVALVAKTRPDLFWFGQNIPQPLWLKLSLMILLLGRA